MQIGSTVNVTGGSGERAWHCIGNVVQLAPFSYRVAYQHMADNKLRCDWFGLDDHKRLGDGAKGGVRVVVDKAPEIVSGECAA